MPADQLSPTALEEAVRAVLGATPLHQAAARAKTTAQELQAAADLYHQAGTRALRHHRPGRWWQADLEFTDWERAETTVRLLLPRLAPGPQSQWWFIRKHPCWRLRVRPLGHAHRARIEAALDDHVGQGLLIGWCTVVYEPETAAFGGPAGMQAAHALFHADSAFALHPPPGLPLGRRELSLALCSALLTGAGLEWYEQGDVWDAVAAQRPLPAGHEQRIARLADQAESLLCLDSGPQGPLFAPGGPLSSCAGIAEAFHTCGAAIGSAARSGQLQRGLRAVLAYHVIFHWNRHGLGAGSQALLARAARTAILHPPSTPMTSHGER
ncbi:thiopeptide-type bacteriocin biosynthesis protein [Nocardiopsis composta]|uniref:Thiopeptide-type bacteriocin biosynthesis protein n=1 Tax=Nocardiopsis composta TaxID=157465 RepID=A0A7W8QGM8_9ACTN|nr:thiopeptide-type bacteriocin biosynthesis protein [Nocardiopsis composta]MBB5429920.1 thiopeptide-type bacteriocin biosynthesis protein [Nocardiopsis composta]